MELNWISPNNPKAEQLARVAELEENPDNSAEERRERRTAITIVNLIDALESCDGPAKWVKLSRSNVLEFYAFDPAQLASDEKQTIPQVLVWIKSDYCEIRYELPHEHRPWRWTFTFGSEYPDPVSGKDRDPVTLILDAFSRCESRRENLVTKISKKTDAQQ